MTLGFIYAGQGSQYVGQGADFYKKYDLVKEIYKNATDIVTQTSPVDLAKLSFEGPIEQLSQTRYTQPAMVTFAIAVTSLLKEAGIEPDYTCGLSLGEYSALFGAGILDQESVLSLIAKRGLYMEQASWGLDVRMAAVLGADREMVEECCQKATEEYGGQQFAAPANYNCPGQIVISGHSNAVDKASLYLKEAGAKRLMPLKVSGPFHTKLMEPAGEALALDLAKTIFNKAKAQVIYNCLGAPKAVDDSIVDLLVRQISSPVYMEDSIRYMANHGVDTIVEIGPGKALSKFVAKTAPEIRVLSIDKLEDFDWVVKEI